MRYLSGSEGIQLDYFEHPFSKLTHAFLQTKLSLQDFDMTLV